METEKTALSLRSLSLSIIQSQQNREACRAQQHHSELEILHFALFSRGKTKQKWKRGENMFLTMSPDKDENTVDVMSLRLLQSLKGAIRLARMDSFVASSHY